MQGNRYKGIDRTSVLDTNAGEGADQREGEQCSRDGEYHEPLDTPVMQSDYMK